MTNEKDETLVALGAQTCRICHHRATKRAWFTPQNGELPEEDEMISLCDHCATRTPADGNLLIFGDL